MAGSSTTAPARRLADRKTKTPASITTSPFSDPATQQRLLDLVHSAFSAAFAHPDTLAATVQQVKRHLYDRDYLSAFSSPDYLLAYFLRWSPARALAYLSVVGDLCAPTVPDFLLGRRRSAKSRSKRVLCIGGGAGGEVLAFTCLVRMLRASDVHVLALDIADWNGVFSRLRDGISTSSAFLPSSSSKSTELDTPFTDVKLEFTQLDVLDSSALDFSTFGLLTMLFTTNELFAQSKPRAIAFLRHLSATCLPGTLLLVLESAGSYSNITVGTKIFPLHYLLDHTLTSGDTPSWRILKQDDAAWFRLESSGLRYPLQLENMRFFLRFYEHL
ncbi:uncharacterized protein V1518DRAFT_418071 [Limtongia smithiae]|uniref:uncharacterized protein n=1 Tax=Limtongia smithiae TaxID=1125753 RepID=UPI0034CE5207